MKKYSNVTLTPPLDILTGLEVTLLVQVLCNVKLLAAVKVI